MANRTNREHHARGPHRTATRGGRYGREHHAHNVGEVERLGISIGDKVLIVDVAM